MSKVKLQNDFTLAVVERLTGMDLPTLRGHWEAGQFPKPRDSDADSPVWGDNYLHGWLRTAGPLQAKVGDHIKAQHAAAYSAAFDRAARRDDILAERYNRLVMSFESKVDAFGSAERPLSSDIEIRFPDVGLIFDDPHDLAALEREDEMRAANFILKEIAPELATSFVIAKIESDRAAQALREAAVANDEVPRVGSKAFAALQQGLAACIRERDVWLALQPKVNHASAIADVAERLRIRAGGERASPC